MEGVCSIVAGLLGRLRLQGLFVWFWWDRGPEGRRQEGLWHQHGECRVLGMRGREKRRGCPVGRRANRVGGQLLGS